MKMLKYIFSALMVASFSVGYSQGFETTRERELTSDQMQALERFMQSKHVVTNDKANLNLDGEAQVKYLRLNAKQTDGTSLVGSGANQSAKNVLEARIYLNFKARADRAWADMRLRFKNRLGLVGQGTGVSENVTLGSVNAAQVDIQAANVGYFILDDGVSTWNVMGGREQLDRLFDSNLQFGSLMDGVTTKYITNVSNMFDFGARAAAILVEAKSKHFGYVAQFDFMNLWNTGLYARYSYTNWSKNGTDIHINNRHDLDSLTPGQKTRLQEMYWGYHINQFQVGYEFAPEVLQNNAQVFGEYLYNSKAKSLNDIQPGVGKQNKAWALGARLGQLKEEGDWYAQVRYERAEAQSRPFWDANGIGRGGGDSASIGSFENAAADVLASFGNYRGWIIEGAYAFTNEMTGKLVYEKTKPLKKDLGTMGNFSQFEGRVSYTF